MRQTTKEIFEHHQVRKSKKQKTAFIDFATQKATALGYTAAVEKGYLGARNIVVGDPCTARVVYTAHYDTCARMPFPNFITPKNIFIYVLYQFAIIFGFFAVSIAAGITVGVVAGFFFPWYAEVGSAVALLVYFFLFFMLMAGPANKHTANDNTSGVTTLFAIMEDLPVEVRGHVAFIFFDLEEAGLFGSSACAAKHKKEMINTLLLNFDCVSDGDTVLFVPRRRAHGQANLLKTAFPNTDRYTVDIALRRAIYPSDQANFPCGVGVATLRRTKGGLLYMNRIHTKHDTVYEEANIEYLTAGAVRLASLL